MIRIAIFSTNYNSPKPVDAFRQGLFKSFEKRKVKVFFIQATDYFSDITSEERLTGSNQIVIDALKQFKPHGVLFLNACGRTIPIQEYLAKQKIPSLTWFWDHPAIHSEELIESSDYHKFASCNKTFIKWFKNYRKEMIDIKFIPFPAEFPEKHKESNLTINEYLKRRINILFMGTLWNSRQFENILYQFFEEEDSLILKSEFIKKLKLYINDWNSGSIYNKEYREDKLVGRFRKRFKNSSQYQIDINNYLSSQLRLEYLLSMKPFGLSLFGPNVCWTEIASNNTPYLVECYQGQNVTNYNKLLDICNTTKIGLNIFHTQNQGGGTNFRFLEYAISKTPILSNRNKECEKIFKNGESVFYYNDANDLKQICKNIQKDPELLVKCANTTYDVAKDIYNVNNIINEIFELLDIKSEMQKEYSKHFIHVFDAKSSEIITLKTELIATKKALNTLKLQYLNNKKMHGYSRIVKKNPTFNCSIDRPLDWSIRKRLIRIKGWCYSLTDAPIISIKATVRTLFLIKKEFHGHYGIDRLDVYNAFPYDIFSRRCGFYIDLELPLVNFIYQIKLEAKRNGKWELFLKTNVLKVGKAYLRNFLRKLKFELYTKLKTT